MIEEWVDIKDYEGLYQVSNLGRVKSLERYEKCCSEGLRKRSEKILSPGVNSAGYNLVVLYKNAVRKEFQVHRMVAEAFIPNPDNLLFVNHKDEDKTNNVVFNLEWCTAEYNLNYGTRNQRISKPVVQYTEDGQFIKQYPSTTEAAKQTGINQGNISTCL